MLAKPLFFRQTTRRRVTVVRHAAKARSSKNPGHDREASMQERFFRMKLSDLVADQALTA